MGAAAWQVRLGQALDGPGRPGANPARHCQRYPRVGDTRATLALQRWLVQDCRRAWSFRRCRAAPAPAGHTSAPRKRSPPETQAA
jgi:hypothetical protein